MKMAEKASNAAFLVDVYLISKTAPSEPISYFSSLKLNRGTLIKVPLRNSIVPAVVLSSRSVVSAKESIRKSAFQLRKVKKSDISAAALSSETLDAMEKTAHYYATSIGALLSIFLPKLLLAETEFFLPLAKKKERAEISKDIELYQMEVDERYGQYRALVRQAFARGSSAIFVVPTHLDCSKAQKELSKGIEEYTYLFNLQGKKSELKKLWNKALNEAHPVLFITTPTGILFPRGDIDTVIVERENSRSYRTLVRPYINIKKFIEHWTKENKFHLVLGDSVLSLETLWREKRGDFGESSLIRWRLHGATTRLIESAKGHDQDGRFQIISPELKEFINKAIAEKEKILLFGARKGLAPTTVCGDCGTVLPCLNCGAPVVLHIVQNDNIYICHACGARRESATVCGYCGSWKLVPLGIGIDEIARAARALFPKVPVSTLDRDHAPTDAKARDIVEKFEKQGGILVSTELAFFHIEQVPYSAVVSLDTLFSIPDFGINERIFYLVSRLREITLKEALAQTKNIGKQILFWATHGNIIDFYQEEIKEREELLYPPFSIFIKITVPKKSLQNDLEKLKTLFADWQPDTLKDSLVMRMPRDNWPEEELVRKLALLPPQYSIKVDAESLL